MNVAGIGSFSGGLAGGYLEAQADAANNKRNLAAAGLDTARAGAYTGQESREADQYAAEKNSLQKLAAKWGPDVAATYHIASGLNRMYPGHPMVGQILGTLPKELQTPMGYGAQPTGDPTESNSALPKSTQPGSDSPNAGGQVMP